MDYIVTPSGWLLLALQAILFMLCSPLLVGWVKQLKARLQNRRGAGLLQPYRDLRKLFAKQVMISQTTSFVFTSAPYIVFGSTLLAASAIPLIILNQDALAILDMIALIGIIALARFFLALAAIDSGTAFGGMGASREMLVSSLAEPATLLAVFTLAMHAHSTNLTSIVQYNLDSRFVLSPSYLFALCGLLLVAIAETGRIPVDNPDTHLELTMIHEAMILEYSGRYLALMEWAAQIRFMLYAVLIANLFFPWGIAASFSFSSLSFAMIAILSKLFFLASLVAIMETLVSKMRLFRVPQYLNLAFLLSLLGLFSYIILETGT